MFWKNKKLKSSARKIDKIVTSVIIWWAVAWAFWLSKTKKWKQITSNYITPNIKKVTSKWVSLFWKTLVKLVSIFSKKK